MILLAKPETLRSFKLKNRGFGASTLLNNTTGGNSVAIGRNALRANTNNTFGSNNNQRYG